MTRQKFQVFSAGGAEDAIDLFKSEPIDLVITDMRMPGMDGMEVLAKVKQLDEFVEVIILTGFADIETAVQTLKNGRAFDYLTKPIKNIDVLLLAANKALEKRRLRLDNQARLNELNQANKNLKLEIRQALDQYDLVQSNKRLHEKIVEQNAELKKTNENLELLVQKRTKTLEIQNQALELSRAILEDLPVSIIGVSAEGMIVLVNRKAHSLFEKSKGIEVGRRLLDYFSNDVVEKMTHILTSNTPQTLKGYQLARIIYDIDLVPLSGKFRDQGVVLTLKHRRISF